MTPVYNRTLVGVATNPCAGAPSISSCTAVDDGLDPCSGGAGGWTTHATCVVGTLQPNQELVWERELDQSGSWAEFARTTANNSGDTTHHMLSLSSDGGGPSSTGYWRARVSVVGVGRPASEACTGPVQSNLLSQTANSCAI